MSADNVTLLTFLAAQHAAVRRAAAAPDISCLPGPQQQTGRSGTQRSTDGTDRRTNRWTDRHHTIT